MQTLLSTADAIVIWDVTRTADTNVIDIDYHVGHADRGALSCCRVVDMVGLTNDMAPFQRWTVDVSRTALTQITSIYEHIDPTNWLASESYRTILVAMGTHCWNASCSVNVEHKTHIALALVS